MQGAIDWGCQYPTQHKTTQACTTRRVMRRGHDDKGRVSEDGQSLNIISTEAEGRMLVVTWEGTGFLCLSPLLLVFVAVSGGDTPDSPRFWRPRPRWIPAWPSCGLVQFLLAPTALSMLHVWGARRFTASILLDATGWVPCFDSFPDRLRWWVVYRVTETTRVPGYRCSPPG